MFKKIEFVAFAFVFLFLTTSESLTKNKTDMPSTQLYKATGEPMATLININNFSYWIHANGLSGTSPYENNPGNTGQPTFEGVFFPHGTATVVYADGIVWGGSVKNGEETEFRVGGQTWATGTTAGRILSPGLAENPNAPDVRIWRIRKDYQTADLRRDAAEFNNVSIDLVTETQIKNMRNQYEKDWNEWPWQKGAPFYDTNGNRIRDNGEEPGLLNADQVVWFVVNDLDSTTTRDFYGSPPIGLEMQGTLWAYNQPEILSNVIFKRYRLIYKGTDETLQTAQIDSMYIAQWADTDLGYPTDDLAGCDTTLQMGFTFNSRDFDPAFEQFHLAPPAISYALLQGPIVKSDAPLASARFNFGTKQGYKNLRMSTFFLKPVPGWFPDPYDALTWYRTFRGFTPINTPIPEPYYDSHGKPTKFPYCGDPISGTGDFHEFYPREYRFAVISGPFTMALGDTQEVIIGLIGGLGNAPLLSLGEVQRTTAQVQKLAEGLFKSSIPALAAKVVFINEGTTQLAVNARTYGASKVWATLSDYSGQLLKSVQLFDDGAHQDSLSGDGLFGNVIDIEPMRQGISLGLLTVMDNDTLRWPRLQQQVPTFGPVAVTNLAIQSDNINSNGIINPGENIHLSAVIGNGSNLNIDNLHIVLATEDPWVVVERSSQILNSLSKKDTTLVVYDIDNPDSYSSLQVSPNTPSGHSFEIKISIYDEDFNLWKNQIMLTVTPFPTEPEFQVVTHTEGPSTGTFGINIVDPGALTGHTYRITIDDTTRTIAERTLNLINLTIGDTILHHHPLPDELSHNMPVTDGFKLNRGSLIFDPQIKQIAEVEYGGKQVSPPIPVWHQANSSACYAISSLSQDTSLKAITLSSQDHDLEFRFTERGGFAFWLSDPVQRLASMIPFELWDIGLATPEDQIDDTRLIPVIWNPFNGSLGVFDIEPDSKDSFFGLPVSDRVRFATGEYAAFEADAADGYLTYNDFFNWLVGPIVIVDLDQDGQLPPPGTTIRIITEKGPSSLDTFEFTPVYTSISETPKSRLPETFELFQNYPNPFNPNTTICYYLPVETHVTLSIFNVLGQEVVRLIDEKHTAGKYQIQWNGKNSSGSDVASGLYFYKIKAEQFKQVNKMLLVR